MSQPPTTTRQKLFHPSYTIVKVVLPADFELPSRVKNGIYHGRTFLEAARKAARKLFTRIHAKALNLPMRKFNLGMIVDKTSTETEQAEKKLEFYMRSFNKNVKLGRFVDATCAIVPNMRMNKFSTSSHVLRVTVKEKKELEIILTQ